jgi:hypothetical protein
MKRNVLVTLAALVLQILFATTTGAQNQARIFPPKPSPAQTSGDSEEKTQASSPGRHEGATDSGVTADATTTCAYTFTSNATATAPYMQYCVTVNGNIVEFQSPKGIESIKEGVIGEGYGICDVNTGTAYYDWAQPGDSGNWNAPTTVTDTKTEVKIERTTTDGAWTLTQTITQVAAGGYAKIVMALKNNSDASKDAYLMRWASVNPANNANNGKSNLDGTVNSVWGYIPDGGTNQAFGLMLQNIGPQPTSIRTFSGIPLNTIGPIDSCNPTSFYDGTLQDVDGSILMLYVIAGIAKETTSTVTMKYFAF